jgi:cytochrome oxidase Cu insertion factor (SCO1/SenC/PrrC family)
VPGMGHGLLATNPVVVAAFQAALRHQGLIVVLLMALILNALAVRTWLRTPRAVPTSSDAPSALGEPSGRRVVRIAFGILWIFDGVLQAQVAMPLGMPSQVVQPAASTSPGWVQHLVTDGLTIWTRHPISAAVSVVWIQIGIGAFLLVAPRGWWSRAAGLLGAGWGLVVWVFGEAFGGVFGHGLSWMFGAPGAAVFYTIAGVLVALPDRVWTGQRLGRIVLGSGGAFFLGMALLQAWPGRGFWQGQPDPHTTAGAITAMAQAMSQTPQPHAMSAAVSWFAGFDARHGWAVNLVFVVALTLVGAAMLAAAVRWRPRIATAAVLSAAVVCVADWVFVQDLGFFGGVGTDPNSMIPLLVILVTGYVACTRPFAESHAAVPEQLGQARWVTRFGAATALGALGIVLVGAVPMASASVNSHADPILTEALNGDPATTNVPAYPFNLVDQHGRAVSLASLRGRSIALTFLDPVCTSDCPLIAQQFRQADLMLGSAAKHAVFVAIVANPIYHSESFVQAFDQQERLDTIPNWLFLTGSVNDLQRTWDNYGYQVQTLNDGAMVAHDEIAYIIDPAGKLRTQLGSDVGPDSQTASSFATLLANEMRTVTP